MQIGELSRRSGVSRDTLRYYEKLGLLAPVGRSSSNGYKARGPCALARLRHVKARLAEMQQGCHGARGVVDGVPNCLPPVPTAAR